jgi:hypothetical protein
MPSKLSPTWTNRIVLVLISLGVASTASASVSIEVNVNSPTAATCRVSDWSSRTATSVTRQSLQHCEVAQAGQPRRRGQKARCDVSAEQSRARDQQSYWPVFYFVRLRR